jgi:hypothetical protein
MQRILLVGALVLGLAAAAPAAQAQSYGSCLRTGSLTTCSGTIGGESFWSSSFTTGSWGNYLTTGWLDLGGYSTRYTRSTFVYPSYTSSYTYCYSWWC